jgi:polysaccharide chain length determinant protein (PEP-CTERM system associated)
MMDQSQEILKYLDMAKRRKYWVIIPFLVVLLGGLGYYLRAPKVYEAETLILVQAQKVPQDFVRSIISEDVEDRLRTITQQVTSRTNLEKIISEFRLADNVHGSPSLEGVVEAVRKRIKIDVKGGRGGSSAFTISFRGKDPKKVAQVANALASNFISQNLEIRESQALGTSSFLADELESVREQLMEKEEQLKKYREHYMGGLPEQLNTNLAMLERLQAQSDQLHSNMRDAENRKITIQQSLDEAEKRSREVAVDISGQGQEARDLTSLRNELASLRARYTENHPDVIRLKKIIEELETAKPDTTGGKVSGERVLSRTEQSLMQQLRDIDLEILSLRDEIRKVDSQSRLYQRRVEETPKREQELLTLQRDYENLKELYDSLLNRKLEADIAVSMEKKQKGEQFRVIDPAKVPTSPIEPDVRRIFLMTIALGFGLGAGLAYLLEMMDTSYRDPDEVEKELKVPVLVSIPIRHTEREIKAQRIKETLKAASVAVGFAVCAVGVVIGTKGVGKTIEYLKTVLEKM